ncbi:MAG: metallophosphoesterase [Planctomycetes bacterium]|nr:metallophosphoesterase [Planctomycetota bacterium]
MKAKWWRRGLWLAGFGCLWIHAFDDPPLATGAYVQDVRGDAATLAMVTAAPQRVGGTVRDDAGAVVAELAAPSARRRHALRAEGLRAGRNYTYELRDAGNGALLDRGGFRTPPADDRAPVRFAFLGDSGGLPGWIWLQRTALLQLPARLGWLPDGAEVTAIGAAVAAWRPDFVLHLGDVVYPKGQHAHYASGFFRPFAGVMRDAPLYAVLGNHDQMDSAGLQMLANLRLPPSDQTGDGRGFSFAWGPVRIVGLDCNIDRIGDHFAADHPALEFLAEQLAVATEPWIVVASHFPLRSQSRQRNRGDLLLHLLPSLRDHQVSLYLSGHDHCYQRRDALPPAGEPPLVVSGGGGKSLYEVRPGEGFVVESAYHWCSAEVRGDRLRVEAHGIDGRQIDAFEVGLPDGEQLAALGRSHPARAARIAALGRGR